LKQKLVFLGDVNSINIELIQKSHKLLKNKVNYLIIGNVRDLSEYLKKLSSNLDINEIYNPLNFKNFKLNSLNIFNVDDSFVNDVKKKLLNNNEIIEDKFIREVATKIREKEALAATRYVGLKDKKVHFLRLPFYESGKIVKNKTSKHDSDLMSQIITKIKPHQIYAAGDLADPHGTHAVCIKLLFQSLEKLKKEKFMSNCWVWLYRGAWHEWEINEIDMAVPLSPQQVLKKRKSIFFHKSQNNSVMFQGEDKREFWERVEERNRDIAKQYRKLGMADYQAMETFRRYHF